MGAPMARRIADSGYDIAVWNRTAGRVEEVAGATVIAASSGQEAVAGRDVVITMLSDAAAVAEVIGGLALDPGTVVVEMSTIGTEAVRSLRVSLSDAVELVDAPVLGSVPQAAAGELRIFAGGRSEAMARCQEVLSVLGVVEHCGPLGSGAAVKLVVNLANITSIVALGEALGLAHELDLDRDLVFDALGRTVLGGLAGGMRHRVDDPNSPVVFTVGLAEVSMRLVLAAGGDTGGVAAAALRQLTEFSAGGLVDRDVSAVVRRLADD